MRSAAPLLLALASLTLTACPPEDGLHHLNPAPIADLVVAPPDSDVPGQRLGWAVQGAQTWLDATHTTDENSLLEELDFRWAFDLLPEGSALNDADLAPAEPHGFATFTPDVVGTFRIAVVATDRSGVASESAIAVVQVTPPMELTATLAWDVNRVDLDLHLLSEDGSYFGDSDCFSWNPNPNWGDAGLSDDDPLLADDEDGEGAGPYREIIDLRQPAEGEYRVLVHYYLDHGLALGQDARPATPTIRIEAGGELLSEFEAPAPLLEDDVWIAGVVEWPGAFAPINLISDHESELQP